MDASSTSPRPACGSCVYLSVPRSCPVFTAFPHHSATGRRGGGRPCSATCDTKVCCIAAGDRLMLSRNVFCVTPGCTHACSRDPRTYTRGHATNWYSSMQYHLGPYSRARASTLQYITYTSGVACRGRYLYLWYSRLNVCVDHRYVETAAHLLATFMVNIW